MCTRTKTTWGCGHYKKTTVPCKRQGPLCDEDSIDRWHLPQEGDCHTCKTSSIPLDRGKAGRGRCGKEIEAKRRRGGSTCTTSPPLAATKQRFVQRETFTEGLDDGFSKLSQGSSRSSSGDSGKSSPWIEGAADKRGPERKLSGIRLEQDAEWEAEHQRRMDEIKLHRLLFSDISRSEHDRRAVLKKQIRLVEEARHIEEVRAHEQLRRAEEAKRKQSDELRRWMEDERLRRNLRRERELRSVSGGSKGSRSGYGSSQDSFYEDDANVWKGRKLAGEIRERWRD